MMELRLAYDANDLPRFEKVGPAPLPTPSPGQPSASQ